MDGLASAQAMAAKKPAAPPPITITRGEVDAMGRSVVAPGRLSKTKNRRTRKVPAVGTGWSGLTASGGVVILFSDQTESLTQRRKVAEKSFFSK